MEKDVIQIIGGITINVDVSIKNICEKDYIWNPTACNCENGKYLASIITDDLVIMCDEIKQSYEEETNFNEKKAINQK